MMDPILFCLSVIEHASGILGGYAGNVLRNIYILNLLHMGDAQSENDAPLTQYETRVMLSHQQ